MKSEVIAVRVPKELKDELEKLDVDYAEAVRSMLEMMVKRKKLKKALADADRFRRRMGRKTGITRPSGAEIIRWDRDHGH